MLLFLLREESELYTFMHTYIQNMPSYIHTCALEQERIRYVLHCGRKPRPRYRPSSTEPIHSAKALVSYWAGGCEWVDTNARVCEYFVRGANISSASDEGCSGGGAVLPDRQMQRSVSILDNIIQVRLTKHVSSWFPTLLALFSSPLADRLVSRASTSEKLRDAAKVRAVFPHCLVSNSGGTHIYIHGSAGLER